ncbi:MAG: hypothetical protein ACXWZP_08165 [Gaiellaceae bacterium]
MTVCPRCGEGVATGQEYCLECGLRLPGVARLGPQPASTRRLAFPLVLAAVVAAGGAAAAIALTRETATATPVFTATGGSEVVPASTRAAAGLAEWPEERSGWTNILVSVPKVDGRDAAVARAEQARRRGLRGVGVLDSSRYPSLHPGYWVVFSGVYPSEPEAASRLREAKGVQRGARTARVSP